MESVHVEVNYAEGDTVRVVSGPLEGFTGIVKSIVPDANKVTVTVSMFGRDNDVELELGQVAVEN